MRGQLQNENFQVFLSHNATFSRWSSLAKSFSSVATWNVQELRSRLQFWHDVPSSPGSLVRRKTLTRTLQEPQIIPLLMCAFLMIFKFPAVEAIASRTLCHRLAHCWHLYIVALPLFCHESFWWLQATGSRLPRPCAGCRVVVVFPAPIVSLTDWCNSFVPRSSLVSRACVLQLRSLPDSHSKVATAPPSPGHRGRPPCQRNPNASATWFLFCLGCPRRSHVQSTVAHQCFVSSGAAFRVDGRNLLI